MPFSREINISSEDREKLKRFEALREKMFQLSEDELKAQMHRLSVLRLSSSQTNTGQSSLALKKWNEAQALIYNHSSSLFSFDFIRNVNEILTGDSLPERTQDIFAGGASFLPNEEKDKELDYFKREVLPFLKEHHPIVASTALRYWIVSLHPFKDGNGRTSQSLGDAWLLMNQFPPLFFKNAYQGQFAFIPRYREDFGFKSALQSSFVGLNNAFKFILNP